jgi:phosphoglycolate phosphatase
MTARAVLFDLDGTLTDSRPGILRSVRYAFESLSEREGRRFDLPPDEALDWIIGPPLKTSFATLAGGEHADQLIELFRERYFVSGAFENEVYEGVPEVLKTLRETGARLFVVTSKHRGIAAKILEHFGLAHCFDAIHGSLDDGGLSDKTELIRHALVTHSLDSGRARAAMVGDRKFDMIGARNNGIAAFGALWGYGGEAELREAGADAVLQRPSEIIAAGQKTWEPASPL